MWRSASVRSQTWHTPAVGVAIGLVFLVAAWVGDTLVLGLVMLAIMVLFSVAILLLARRSEAVRGLLDRRDERINALDMRATGLAGGAMVIAALIGMTLELSRGHSNGAPYTWLCAVYGLAYLGSLVIQWVRG